MIKQNIKVAILSILIMLALWLILLIFIKVDVSTKGIITFVDNYNYLTIDSTNASYIENNSIDYVKMEYERQYFSCHITYSSGNEEYKYYLISLPTIVDKTQNYLETNIIIDSINVYKYWLKK